MKKLVMFFIGLLLMCLMFGMVIIGAAMYDTSSQQTIDTFFFQPADLSAQRIGVPAALDDLSSDDIRKMLVEKFITEYFYVIPDMNNIDARLKGTMGLRYMVSANVFNDWVATTGNEISKMAANKSMRFARLVDMQLPHDSENWWTITYELTTWTAPNDLAHAPSVTRGIMYINLNYEPGIRPTMYDEEFDMGESLENGDDPSLMFKFRVENVE